MVIRVHDDNAYAMFIRAEKLSSKGEKKAALRLSMQIAKSGKSDAAAAAQHNVGFSYDTGIGTKKNHKLALYWYKMAWKNSNQTDSCSNIAAMYLSDGNRARALYWWKKAIKRGDGDAAFDLAKYYLSLRRRDLKIKAIKLLKDAVISEHICEASREDAKMLLKQFQKKPSYDPEIFINRYGVPVYTSVYVDVGSFDKIVNAVEDGDVFAQNKLGQMYEHGMGAVKKDIVMAYKWFDIAGTYGYEEAKKNRERIRVFMTPRQIKDGKKLVKDYEVFNNSRVWW